MKFQKDHSSDAYPAYIEYSKTRGRKLRKTNEKHGDQPQLGFPAVVTSSLNEKVNSLILQYVIGCMTSVNTVDRPEFRDLIKGNHVGLGEWKLSCPIY